MIERIANWRNLENSWLWPYPSTLDLRELCEAKLEELIKPEELVLDVGSCEGRWRSTCSRGGAAYLTLDYLNWLSNYGLSKRKLVTDLPDMFGDCRQICLADSSVDKILLFDVLEHIDRPELAIRQLVNTLKPGGMLFLTVPYLIEIHGGENNEDDWYRFTPASLKSLASEAGLRNIAINYVGAFGSSLSTLVSGYFIRNLNYRPGLSRYVWMAFGALFVLLTKLMRGKLDTWDLAERTPTHFFMIALK